MDRAFASLPLNSRAGKPRTRGVTEIRGPYYTPMGKRYLQDILETMGNWVDALKFAGGSFSLMPRPAVKELLDLCHSYQVEVSTGGFIEHVLTLGPQAVNGYIEECKALGFDIIEISSGFITIPTDDWLRLVEKVRKAGLKAKPEVGIQFGAGGASAAAELEAETVRRASLPGFAATTGVPAVNHQFMVAKLLWLAGHCPGVWQQMKRLCLVSDYLTLLLTGQHVSEAGAAGLTGLVAIEPCRWWAEMLDRWEIPTGCLAAIARAGTSLGPITNKAAQRFHLPGACRFVVGCLDQYAGAIGAGNVRPGLVSETTGTVLATVRCTDGLAAAPGPGVFQGPAFAEGLYYQMVFGDVSARYLEWYRQQLPDRPDFEHLAALAAGIAPGADGLRLRTDVPLTTPEQVLAGMAPQHGRGHVVRCIMETVAGALAGQVAALGQGSTPELIRSAGGAARSDLWLQIKADVLGVPVAATECEEPTSLGAAILAEASLAGEEVPAVAQRWVRLKPEVGVRS